MGTATKIVDFVNKVLNPYGVGFKEAQFNSMYSNSEANCCITYKDIKPLIPTKKFNIDDEQIIFKFYIKLGQYGKEKGQMRITAYDYYPQLNINAIKSYVTKMKTEKSASPTGFYSSRLFLDNEPIVEDPAQCIQTTSEIIKDHIAKQIDLYKNKVDEIEEFLFKNDLQTFADEVKKQEDKIKELSESLRDYKTKFYNNLKLVIEANKDFK